MEQQNLPGNRAELLDNGQWHLAIDISSLGFRAWLVPDDILGRSPRLLASSEWAYDSASLLDRIENAVYDNPEVLDDYSADIVLECGRELWLPTEDYADDDDCAEAYVSIYGGDILDVVVNDLGQEKVAYSLAPGLKSFMERSFPGARIWSQLALLRLAAKTPHDSYKCLLDIRQGEADFVLVDRGMLCSASTHPWKSVHDIIYTMFAILRTYDADPKDTELVLSGLREARQTLGVEIEGLLKNISQKNHDLEGKSIPTGISLAINRKKQNANNKR